MNITSTAHRWAIAGFAVAIASLVALFICGAVIGSAHMMVVASSGIASASATAAAVTTSLRKKATR